MGHGGAGKKVTLGDQIASMGYYSPHKFCHQNFVLLAGDVKKIVLRCVGKFGKGLQTLQKVIVSV